MSPKDETAERAPIGPSKTGACQATVGVGRIELDPGCSALDSCPPGVTISSAGWPMGVRKN
jgi:hypothetical protein